MNQFINGYDEKWNQAPLDSEQKKYTRFNDFFKKKLLIIFILHHEKRIQ